MYILIFITTGEYEDELTYDNNNVTGIKWCGQKKTDRWDNLVLENNNTIHIWYRENSRQFKYLGEVIKKDIIQRRDTINEKILKIEFSIKRDSLIIPVNTLANCEERIWGDGVRNCYKRDCFRKLNMRPKGKGNMCNGIIEAEQL